MSRIIRSPRRIAAHGALGLNHRDARGTGDDPAERLKLEAERLLESAQARSKEIEEEAFDRGYETGMKAASRESSGYLTTLESICLQAAEEKERIIKAAELEIANLSTRIAEKIIGEEVKADPEVVMNVAKRAIELATDREQIIVRVNPADLEMIRSRKEKLLASVDGTKHIQAMADERVKRGGCVIETNSGNVDAKISSQLGQIEESLRGVIGD